MTDRSDCNCEQALALKAELASVRESRKRWRTYSQSADQDALRLQAQVDALQATAARQGRKLAAIDELLQRQSRAPLRQSRFDDFTLEAIRVAMLERPW